MQVVMLTNSSKFSLHNLNYYSCKNFLLYIYIGIAVIIKMVRQSIMVQSIQSVL